MRRLASAAAELATLHIDVTLREVQAETPAAARQIVEGWLALLEARKPALSEQRYGSLICMCSHGIRHERMTGLASAGMDHECIVHGQ